MIKKILLINGSPNEHGCTDVALLEAAASAEAAQRLPLNG